LAKLSDDELGAITDAFERLLRDQCSEQHVRAWMEDKCGYDDNLWQAMAQMGITGLLVAEEHGGAGVGMVAVERIMEIAGSALLGAPLLTSAVMSVAAIQASGDESACSNLLPGIADGSSIATLLMTGPSGGWCEETVDLQAKANDEEWHLSGKACYVLHARNADVWLAVANTDAGPSLFEVSPGADGITLSTLPSFDHTLVLDEVVLDGVPATCIGQAGKGWSAIESALNAGIIALAGEQAGGAQHILQIAVEYAKIRHQFGRPIGSFQAIKHMASDLVLEVESATSAARKAATVADDDAEDAATWRNLAGFACADAFTRTAKDAVQMHGGIAFTWEHPAHLYLRRSRADAQLFGTPDAYRERYLTDLGG